MTNKSLQELIDMYNKSSWNVPIREFEIGPNVLHARIPEQFESIDYKFASNYFLIKDGLVCVAIIQDRGETDLHWYVDKIHRGNGNLNKALKATIFPYIVDHLERTYQQVTVANDDPKALEYAKKQVFVDTGRTNNDSKILELNIQSIMKYDKNGLKRNKLSQSRISALQKQLKKMAEELRLIDDELYCTGSNITFKNEIWAIDNNVNDLKLLNSLGDPPSNKPS